MHDPPPEHLGILKVVDWHGWCEFFETKEETNDGNDFLSKMRTRTQTNGNR